MTDPYLDVERFPLTTQVGLDLSTQMRLDAHKLDGLAEVVEGGDVLTEHQQRVLAELNSERALWPAIRDQLRAARRPPAQTPTPGGAGDRPAG